MTEEIDRNPQAKDCKNCGVNKTNNCPYYGYKEYGCAVWQPEKNPLKINVI